jgi:hypothetical protein
MRVWFVWCTVSAMLSAARSEAYDPNNVYSTLAGTTTADFQFMMQQPVALPVAQPVQVVVLDTPWFLRPYRQY